MEAGAKAQTTTPGLRTELPFDPMASAAGSRERLDRSTTIAFVSLAGIGLILVLRQFGAPLATIAVPSALLGAMLCLAKPAATASIVVILTGFIGTVIAHTGIPAESLAQSLLVCIWIAVLFMYATGRARGRLWIWPGLALAALYVVVTAVGIVAAGDTGAAFDGFKIAAWYMAAFVLFAIAPWPTETLRRIVRGVVVIALAVGAYAVFRKIAGSSAEELALARRATAVRASEEIRFFGSFLGPQQLSAWGAVAIPFLIGLALHWRGRWRAVAALAAGLCVFAVIASDIRTGMVGAIAGIVAVLLLYQLSQSFKGPRLAVGLAAAVALVAVAGAGYSTTLAENSSSEDRIQKLLTPGDDFAYQQRKARWELAIQDINQKPLGYGLGTVGSVLTEHPANLAGPVNLDSSYLKIGLEQGYPILLLFLVGCLALLAGIARRAIATRDSWRAALGIAACGTLVTQLILYYGSTYIEGIPALFAWILVGLGAAPFTFVAEDSGAEAENAEANSSTFAPRAAS
jgi:hypothetical protein